MSFFSKHLIIAGVAILLVFFSCLLWVRVEKIKNGGNSESVGFGYPIHFIFQDFTQCPYSYALPWSFKFSPSKECPIKGFNWKNLFFSFSLIFIFLEMIIWVAETIYFRIKNKET